MAEAFQINSLEDEGHQDVVFKVEDIKEEEDSRDEEEGETGVAEAEEVDGSLSARYLTITQFFALSTKCSQLYEFLLL